MLQTFQNDKSLKLIDYQNIFWRQLRMNEKFLNPPTVLYGVGFEICKCCKRKSFRGFK
jgi:hypothetical protein